MTRSMLKADAGPSASKKKATPINAYREEAQWFDNITTHRDGQGNLDQLRLDVATVVEHLQPLVVSLSQNITEQLFIISWRKRWKTIG